MLRTAEVSVEVPLIAGKKPFWAPVCTQTTTSPGLANSDRIDGISKFSLFDSGTRGLVVMIFSG